MNEKAQISFEYLLTVLFSIILVIAAAILLETINSIALAARAQVISERESIASLLTGD